MAIKLELFYNPYKVEATFKVDGEEGIDKSIINLTRNKRLQSWIDKIFPEIFKLYNTQDIDFEFTGTALGAEDVKDAVYLFNKDKEYTPHHINLKLHTSKKSIEDRIEKLKELYVKAQKGPFEKFKSDEMKYSFGKALSPDFEVNVIATMSSGKSTVINAMLGKALMPAKNEACTATIARITNCDDMSIFEACRYDEKQDKMDGWKKVDSKKKDESTLLESWNADNKTSLIEIKGNIPAIKEREGIRLVLVDTPGPNNARDSSHKKVTIKAIKQQLSMVLYILNAAQLNTDDDSSLLRLMKEAQEKGGREAQDRFIFILNKIDKLDPEDGELIENHLNIARKYLIEKGIRNPLIIPVSAELTKLIRINRYEGPDALTRRQKGTLENSVELFLEEEMNMLKHVKNSIGRGTYEKLKNNLKKVEDSKDEHGQAEITSGIPIVEALLDDFILKHAIPAKLKDAVDSFKTVMAEAEDIKSLNGVISQGKEDLTKFSKSMDEFKNDENRINEARKFREKVEKAEYKISDKAKDERTNIDLKIKDLLDKTQEYFEENIEPRMAKIIFKSVQHQCEFLFEEIQEILKESLETDFLDTMKAFRDEYQKYITDLLKKSFPGQDNVSLKEFQANALRMPDTSSLINRNTYEKKSIKIVGTERHGWFWLKKRNVHETTTKDLVDMSDALDELESSIQDNKRKRLKEFEELCKDNGEQAKNILLSNMKELDDKMSDLMKKITETSQDKDKAEKMIKENEEKLKWFDDFKDELEEILAI